MNHLRMVRFILVFSVMIMALTVFSIEINVIKHPKPNMKEKQYVHLQSVKVIAADLGNDEFLFNPTSMTIDENNNLYVYDNLQARIFKFNEDFKLLKSFGRKGQGPGEFSGTGRYNMVVIKIGRDGKLYANEVRLGKIIVFSQNGKYIRDFRYKTGTMLTPIADIHGNVYFTSVKEGIIEVLNEKRSKLLSFDYEGEDFDYLFYKPGPMLLMAAAKKLLPDLSMDFTLNSKLLIYFQNSSTMVVIKDKKIINKIRIWPEEALASYKTEVCDLLEHNKEMFKKLFPSLFVDGDNDTLFYLQLGKNKKRNINALYQFNLKGGLLKIFYIGLKEPSFTRFELNKNNLFYAIEDEKITIYKEEKK